MCVSHLSCFRGRLIKGHFEISAETKTQVDLNFCCILTMDKVHTASTASDGAMKRLFDEFERAKDIPQKDFNRAKNDFEKDKDFLGKDKNQIYEGFEEPKEYQDALAAKNGVLNVNGLEIMDIKAGGVIISVTRETMTQIKGTRLEALFSGRWDKCLLRDGDGRVFLDINPKCFLSVVDYLNKRMITLPDYSLKILYLFFNSFCWRLG